MLLAIPTAASLLKTSGGDMVLLTITPEGQINHYWSRSFGIDTSFNRDRSWCIDASIRCISIDASIQCISIDASIQLIQRWRP